MTARLASLLLLAFVASHATAATQSFNGRVVSVADGDTVTVLDSNNVQHKIRLAGIDAPEKGQPFGDRSKQSLSRAVMGKEVKVVWSKQDRYGRLVGTVWVAPLDSTCRTPPCAKTLDVNLAQLTVGLAWHFKKYANEQSPAERGQYAFAEQEARAKKAGLWSQPDPIPPWVERERRRADSMSGLPRESGSTDAPAGTPQSHDGAASGRSGGSAGSGSVGGVVKKSRSNICHAPDSPSYQSVKNFKAFPTLEACLASGGRLPKQPGG